MMTIVKGAIAAGLVCLAAPLWAQDTRTVTEPRVPAVCTTLVAMTANARPALDEAERHLDTGRIQQAIDTCPAGKAVALASDHDKTGQDKTAFVSGPIELRRGVTLIVQAGVTLYGSRNPRVYDVAAGSCGIVTSEAGGGCRPLIHAKNVTGAAVMGDGTIDGRGGEPLLDQPVSWWDLAQQAKCRRSRMKTSPFATRRTRSSWTPRIRSSAANGTSCRHSPASCCGTS
jgi:polygalacturonase